MQGQRANEAPRFLLDESLPPRVAEALRLVGYQLTSCQAEGTLGWQDEELIPWLASQKYVWVTKDDTARSQHLQVIQRARISVVWVRGLERPGGLEPIQ